MRRILPLFLLIPCVLVAQPPAGYYDAAQGLTGEPLRAALHDIIDDHTVVEFNSLWSYFFNLDRKPNNKIWDIYSDIPGGTPPYEFVFGADQCGEYSGEGQCYNREHSFPQSWFNNGTPMVSDIFHIYPTDGWVNGKRANWPYGTVGSATWTGMNGSKVGSCNYPGCSGTVFEPIDGYKGDLARSYFYMLTRYLGQTQSWSSPMMTNGEFLPWAESMLVAWHIADPVSQKEIDRNNRIFTSVQHNRNPYIDNPQWVQYIWGPTASVQETRSSLGRIWWDGSNLRVTLNTTATNASISVLDVNGRTVVRERFTGSATALALDLASGAYVVVLDTPDGRQVQRVVR
ncbi:MAG: endonuclease [Flavobacteriales bacterium]